MNAAIRSITVPNWSKRLIPCVDYRTMPSGAIPQSASCRTWPFKREKSPLDTPKEKRKACKARESLDIGGPLGRAVVIIIGAIAELERNLIIERVRAGMRRARLEGRHIGRRPLEMDRAAAAVSNRQKDTPSPSI